MKALSVREPWISLIAEGNKTIETRTWNTNYRGPLLLVGSKNPSGPYAGKAACVVEVVDCHPMLESDNEAACCEVYPKAHSWVLGNIRRVKPFPVKGKLSFYEVSDDQITYLNEGDAD